MEATKMEFIKGKLRQGAFAIMAACVSTVAQADIFKYDLSDTGLGDAKERREAKEGDNAGDLKAMRMSYNDADSTFSFSAMLRQTEEGSDLISGFWLVVSSGAGLGQMEGKNSAILYADLTKGRLTAYQYDEERDKGYESYRNGNLFIGAIGSKNENQSKTVEVKVDETNGIRRKFINFSIDATDINSAVAGPNWTGVSFADNIGIWFHGFRPGSTAPFTYNPDGTIRSMNDYNANGTTRSFLDGVNFATTREVITPPTETGAVPTPGVLSLMAIAMLGFIAPLRRKRKVALAAK